MGISKVIYGGETLIDITGVSVTPQTLAEGETALNAAGDEIVGTLKVADEIVTTAGTGSAYTATVNGISELKPGINFIMIPHVVSASITPTLNVNELGAKTIRQPLTTNTSATAPGTANTWLVANKPVRVMYDGTYWKTVEIPRPSASGLYGTAPIASGGTGATTSEAACTNLNAVSYAEQSLTEAQKAQAKKNIGVKTVYEYAQDGGFTGTEAEFAAKLANEYTLNPLYGKKISLIGDSICAGGSDTYVGGYGKIIADRNNMVYENLAQAGSTITAETYSSTTGNAKGWISRMVESMSADADYAIVEGGINDAWQYSDHKNIEIGELTTGYNATLDDTTYYGAFESMLKQLVTKFQGKKIGYIAVPKTMGLYDSNRNAPNFYHIALECCAKWGVPVCDLNTIIPPTEYLKTLGTTYTEDGTHPTYDGYLKYYCDPIEAWMKTLTTGGSVPTGTLPTDLDDKYVLKNDISIKKAQITLEDGTAVLIDVVVASEGTTIKKYTNQVPKSIDTDGSVFNGTGYQEGYRLSSSGAAKAQAGCVVTGYIPVKAGDVIRIYGCDWATALNAHNYICAYNSSFTFIGANATVNTGTFSLTKYTNNVHANYTLDDNYNITLTVAALTDIAYIRVSSKGNTSSNTATFAPEDMIVTVNEEIA